MKGGSTWNLQGKQGGAIPGKKEKGGPARMRRKDGVITCYEGGYPQLKREATTFEGFRNQIKNYF